MKLWKVGLLGLLLYGGFKMVVVLSLVYFTLNDFRGEWPFLAIELLRKLDRFAEAMAKLGAKVVISPAPGSMMRWDKEEEGEHKYGRAIDVMIIGPVTLEQSYEVAKNIGFSGIGVYPDWVPYKGLHLDIRNGRDPGNPAKWAGIKESGKQVYVAIERGFYA